MTHKIFFIKTHRRLGSRCVKSGETKVGLGTWLMDGNLVVEDRDLLKRDDLREGRQGGSVFVVMEFKVFINLSLDVFY